MPAGVVIVSYRHSRHLNACLAAIERDGACDRAYLAANDADMDQIADLLRRHPYAVSLATHENDGFAAGVNRGVARALADGASHVLVLNDDVFVRPGALGRLKAAAGESGVAAPFLAGGGDGEFRGAYIDWETGIAGHRVGAYDYLCGACLMISADAWHVTGPFDEGFFLYYEDVDWCVRARMRGVPMALVTEELAWHAGGASTGGGDDPGVVYWWTRNRLRFVRKHRGYGAAVRIAFGSIYRAARRAVAEPEVSGVTPETAIDGGSPRRGSGVRQQTARVRGIISGLTVRVPPSL